MPNYHQVFETTQTQSSYLANPKLSILVVLAVHLDDFNLGEYCSMQGGLDGN
ncbi:MAG: hypothetical protein HC916_21350 [Coleofasciculaceae cyanobacterium SM2_1_6]|nr:hypothetical protein [Coleofasciculaceae cyanobacterium SM2_1_6]